MRFIFIFTLLFLFKLNQGLSPVIVIPGTGSSQIDAKIDKPATVHSYCSKKSDWFQLWLSVPNLLPGLIDCWSDNIKLIYNEEKDEFTNNIGVETRVPYFGSTEGIEFLDRKLKSASKVWKDLFDELTKHGYQRNFNIYGAPYDFRLAPKSNPTFIQNVTDLIEKAYQEHNNEPVTLISHSMGCLWTLFILNSMPYQWKQKYIKQWIPISPAYGGTVQEMKLMASGDNEGIPWVKGYQVRQEQKSYESNFWLLPNRQLWDDNEELIFTPSKNYTLNDLNEYFDAIGYPQAKSIYKRFQNNTAWQLNAPQVKTYPLYGTQVHTPQGYKYSSDNNWNETPIDLIGDGDGTVNVRSLRAGNQWKNSQNEEVIFQEFEGQSHSGILSHQNLIDTVLRLLLN